MSGAKKKKIAVHKADKFNSITGKGVEVVYKRKKLLIGNRKLMQDKKISAEHVESLLQRLEEGGKTVVIVAVNGKVAGLVAVADTIKESSKSAVASLKNMGKRVIMITGD